MAIDRSITALVKDVQQKLHLHIPSDKAPQQLHIPSDKAPQQMHIPSDKAPLSSCRCVISSAAMDFSEPTRVIVNL